MHSLDMTRFERVSGVRDDSARAVVGDPGSRLTLALATMDRPSPREPRDLQALVEETHARFASVREGANATYIPVLGEVDPDLFGVVVATVDGAIYAAGDADHSFSMQSVAKPFTMALVMQEQGREAIVARIGVEPTGLRFNSITAIELNPERSVNPLVNAGAIAAVSMLEVESAEERWQRILTGFSGFAGEELEMLRDVYASETGTNHRNRAIAHLLRSYERLYCAPEEAVDVYTRQCSIGVTAKQLATMGATLANGGVHPRTGRRVLDPDLIDEILAIMLMGGFYDEVGIWAFRAGLPAKTGVGGGIVAIVPGRMAIAGFSPRVNEAGNSVRALLAIQHVSRELGLSLFLSGRER